MRNIRKVILRMVVMVPAVALSCLLIAAIPAHASGQDFVPSTPEFRNSGLTPETIRDGFRKAIGTLEEAGVSPMAILDRIQGDSSDGQSGTTDEDSGGTEQNPAASLREKAGNVGDDLIREAQNTGDQMVEGAQEQLQETKESFFAALSRSLKEALNSLVDSLFSKL